MFQVGDKVRVATLRQPDIDLPEFSRLVGLTGTVIPYIPHGFTRTKFFDVTILLDNVPAGLDSEEYFFDDELEKVE